MVFVFVQSEEVHFTQEVNWRGWKLRFIYMAARILEGREGTQVDE